MEKLLIDTNIILDLLSRREEFYLEAQQLFTLADHNEVHLIVTALSFANTHYLLSKSLKAAEARKILLKFKILVDVVPFDNKILDLSLVSDFKDFEDAIQYYSAVENGADKIITRK